MSAIQLYSKVSKSIAMPLDLDARMDPFLAHFSFSPDALARIPYSVLISFGESFGEAFLFGMVSSVFCRWKRSWPRAVNVWLAAQNALAGVAAEAPTHFGTTCAWRFLRSACVRARAFVRRRLLLLATMGQRHSQLHVAAR